MYLLIQAHVECKLSIIIIMYIYHALINALSAHMIHINLYMIFYTHIEHSPTKTIYIRYYVETHTHTHTHTHDCSINWVLVFSFLQGWQLGRSKVGQKSICLSKHTSLSLIEPLLISLISLMCMCTLHQQFHSCSDSGTLSIPHVKTKVCVHAQGMLVRMFVSTPRDSMRVHACV